MTLADIGVLVPVVSIIAADRMYVEHPHVRRTAPRMMRLVC